MNKLFSLLGMGLVFLSFSVKASTSYFVTVGGNSGATGLSWDAPLNLDGAITKAVSGDVIYLASGDYNFKDVIKAKTFKVPITLQGGYDQGDDVTLLSPNKTKRAKITSYDETTSSVIGKDRAAILIQPTTFNLTGTFLISDLVFEKFKNTEDNTNVGGAIRVDNNCSFDVTVQNCDFINCEGASASALKVSSDNTSLSADRTPVNIRMKSCLIDGCVATSVNGGGGVIVFNRKNATSNNSGKLIFTLEDVEIKNCQVLERLIAVSGTWEVLNVNNCTIANNINNGTTTNSNRSGCGISIVVGVATININNSLFYGNVMTTGTNAATVINSMNADPGVTFSIKNSSIVGNQVKGAANAPALRVKNTDLLTIEKSIISNNINDRDETKINRDAMFNMSGVTIYNSILNGLYAESHQSHATFNLSGGLTYDDFLTADQVLSLTSGVKSAEQLVAELSVPTSAVSGNMTGIRRIGSLLIGVKVGDKVEVFDFVGRLQQSLLSDGSSMTLPEGMCIVRITDQQGNVSVLK